MTIESVKLNMPSSRDVCAHKSGVKTPTPYAISVWSDKLTITKQRSRSRVALSRVTLFKG